MRAGRKELAAAQTPFRLLPPASPRFVGSYAQKSQMQANIVPSSYRQANGPEQGKPAEVQ